MKDRIIFFVLGAILATIAYFVGDMSKVSAQNGRAVFDELVVRDKLTVYGRTTVLEGLAVNGSIFVTHQLPENKVNVISITADKEGTQIHQILGMDSEDAKPSIYKNSSAWGISNERTYLNLHGINNAGPAITLVDQNTIRAIGVTSDE